jgi:hypothetical protein
MLVCLGRDWPCRVSPVRRSRLSTWPLQRGVRDAFEDDQDRSAFVVASIRGWWRFERRRLYSKVKVPVYRN